MKPSAAAELIGKRISAIVRADADPARDGIGSQLFFVFDDQTWFEIYGRPIPTKGVRIGGLDVAVDYARCCSATDLEVFDAAGIRADERPSKPDAPVIRDMGGMTFGDWAATLPPGSIIRMLSSEEASRVRAEAVKPESAPRDAEGMTLGASAKPDESQKPSTAAPPQKPLRKEPSKYAKAFLENLNRKTSTPSMATPESAAPPTRDRTKNLRRGFLRLWVFLSAPWTTVVGIILVDEAHQRAPHYSGRVYVSDVIFKLDPVGVVVALAPWIALGLVWGTRWVIAGFRTR